jgi:hypothetical protein
MEKINKEDYPQEFRDMVDEYLKVTEEMMYKSFNTIFRQWVENQMLTQEIKVYQQLLENKTK